MRSPRRTAQTASALIVGLALVARDLGVRRLGVPVGYRSRGPGHRHGPDRDPHGVRPAQQLGGVAGLGRSGCHHDQHHLRRAVRVPEHAVQPHRGVHEQPGQHGEPAHDLGHLGQALAQGELLIDSTTAQNKHLAVGDTVPVGFALTGPATLRVGGIFQANALIGSYLVSSAFFLSHYPAQPPAALLLRTSGSTAVDNAVTSALNPYPNIQVQTRAQYEQATVSAINQILGLVYALLALAVIIAAIGIVNTLMLSVFERTREIGLLRAVGMRRRQVRTMIRSEAVILAIFGAIIGIIIGTGMGIALVSSLKNQGVTDTVVPYSELVIFLILAALLGLVAASWPARRAAKLDVLAAIAAQ